jgi:hypothetical protein
MRQPGNHEFVNSDPTKFDSNCVVCGGKHRDAVHAKAEGEINKPR